MNNIVDYNIGLEKILKYLYLNDNKRLDETGIIFITQLYSLIIEISKKQQNAEFYTLKNNEVHLIKFGNGKFNLQKLNAEELDKLFYNGEVNFSIRNKNNINRFLPLQIPTNKTLNLENDKETITCYLDITNLKTDNVYKDCKIEGFEKASMSLFPIMFILVYGAISSSKAIDFIEFHLEQNFKDKDNLEKVKEFVLNTNDSFNDFKISDEKITIFNEHIESYLKRKINTNNKAINSAKNTYIFLELLEKSGFIAKVDIINKAVISEKLTNSNKYAYTNFHKKYGDKFKKNKLFRRDILTDKKRMLTFLKTVVKRLEEDIKKLNNNLEEK